MTIILVDQKGSNETLQIGRCRRNDPLSSLCLIVIDIVRMVVLFFVLPMFDTSVGAHVHYFCVSWLL